MNKFEQAPVFNLDKTCESKSNAVVQAILGRNNDYNINTPHVDKKLLKAVQDVVSKLHLEDSEESRMAVSNLVLKKALETIANDLGGSLRQEPSLENKYIEIIKEEAEDKCYYSREEILETIKELDSHNLLDNERKAELFDNFLANLKEAS